MKIVLQITYMQKKHGASSAMLSSFFEIDIISLVKPSLADFRVGFNHIVKQAKELIPMGELVCYNNFLPIFQANVEFIKKDGEIINHKREAALFYLYSLTDKSLNETAENLFLQLAEAWQESYKKDENVKNVL